MTGARCEVCHALKACWKCGISIQFFLRATGKDVDADFIYHELAHHTVLFRRAPTKREDYRSIEELIDLFPMGIAQLHELRVIALQLVTHTELGWQPTVNRLVSLSWPGIREIDDRHDRGGRVLIVTEEQARAGVLKFATRVSRRNVTIYKRALHRARGEDLSRPSR